MSRRGASGNRTRRAGRLAPLALALALLAPARGETERAGAVSPALAALAAAPVGNGPAALRLALRLAAEVPPARLEAELAADPALAPPALATLATALGAAGDSQAGPLGRYLSAAAVARARRLAAAGRWSAEEVADLVRLQVLAPERLGTEARLRERILTILPGALPADSPAPLRDRALAALCLLPGMSFEAAGAVERGWGAVPREAASRWSDPGAPLRFDADTEGSLAATVFSFPSSLIDPGEAQALLAAVRRLDPERELLVLADFPLRERLAPAALAGGESRQASERPGVTFLDTCGRPYSPWPRDPFSLVRGPGGQVTVLVRPNLQPGRAADATLGPELVQGLPPRLDTAWGNVRWTRAPVPFHNGQVLLAPRTAWVSLHTLEPRILEILGLARVPVASFATAAGIDRYLAAAERARGELAALYGRTVAFVHPLPAAVPEGQRAALMREIGGGAGYDLDSLLTLMPGEPRGEKTRALVADLGLGRSLLDRLPAADWQALRRGYDLAPEASRLPPLLAAAQETSRARGLARYLDLVAGHLRAQGMEVTRLPLLVAPLSLLRDSGGASPAAGELLLGWNNVVVEVRDGRVRAEGFASLLPTADEEARAAFNRAGCRLDLLPPLTESVVRGGGYRCASNHLRVPARGVAPATATVPTPAPAPASRPAGLRRP